MSLHLMAPNSIFEPICGGNAARITDDPHHPSLNCHLCVELVAHADAVFDMGQVVCEGADLHDLGRCDPPCFICDAGLSPRCPDCGAAV